MAEVRVSRSARDDLHRLISLHSLPGDTPDRVVRTVRPLETFLHLGRCVRSDAAGDVRVLLGPWRWMLVVYTVSEDDAVVTIVSFEDSRTSRAVRPT